MTPLKPSQIPNTFKAALEAAKFLVGKDIVRKDGGYLNQCVTLIVHMWRALNIRPEDTGAVGNAKSQLFLDTLKSLGYATIDLRGEKKYASCIAVSRSGQYGHILFGLGYAGQGYGWCESNKWEVKNPTAADKRPRITHRSLGEGFTYYARPLDEIEIVVPPSGSDAGNLSPAPEPKPTEEPTPLLPEEPKLEGALVAGVTKVTTIAKTDLWVPKGKGGRALNLRVINNGKTVYMGKAPNAKYGHQIGQNGTVLAHVPLESLKKV